MNNHRQNKGIEERGSHGFVKGKKKIDANLFKCYNYD